MKIKIIICTATGAGYENVTPGSIHTVVKAPKPHTDNANGVWIKGAWGKAVKVLNGTGGGGIKEYEIIED